MLICAFLSQVKSIFYVDYFGRTSFILVVLWPQTKMKVAVVQTNVCIYQLATGFGPRRPSGDSWGSTQTVIGSI
jgi:hypothetical protein